MAEVRLVLLPAPGAREHAGQAGGVAPFEQETFEGAAEHFRDTADPGTGHRAAGGQRLDHRAAEGLVPRRGHDGDIGGVQRRDSVRSGAEEAHGAGWGQRLEMVKIGLVVTVQHGRAHQQ